MEVIWKPVKDFEGFYEVSNFGEVKALERTVMNNGGLQHKHERILKQGSTGRYKIVSLSKEGKIKPMLVHRLVAQAFIPNPENKPNVDHLDTDVLNNRADNLCWVTQSENAMNPLTRKHNSESKKGHRPYLLSHSEESKHKMSIIAKDRFQKRKEISYDYSE